MKSQKGGPAGIRVPDPHGRVRTRIRPGAKGTKRLFAEYGDRLVCVRYRYDERLARRLKTVEIIVSEAPWNPGPFRRVFVSIEAWETRLRKEVMRAGGRWDPGRGQWHLRYDRAIKLGLRRRSQPESRAEPIRAESASVASTSARPSAERHTPPPTRKTPILVETRMSLPAETSPSKTR
jgi:hypothetical protein